MTDNFMCALLCAMLLLLPAVGIYSAMASREEEIGAAQYELMGFYSHLESVSIALKDRKVTLSEYKEIMKEVDGIKLQAAREKLSKEVFGKKVEDE